MHFSHNSVVISVSHRYPNLNSAYKLNYSDSSGLKTTQKLDSDTLERVRDRGRLGDSFNGVINRLLDRIEDLEEKLEDRDDTIKDQLAQDDDDDND